MSKQHKAKSSESHKKTKPVDSEKLFQDLNAIREAMNEALDIWSDLWKEFEVSVVAGALAIPDEKGFNPKCGWPEFLEKMWEMKQNMELSLKICDKNIKNIKQ